MVHTLSQQSLIYTEAINDCDSQNIAQDGCSGEVRSFKTRLKGKYGTFRRSTDLKGLP